MKTLHINKLHLSAVATAGVLTLPGLAVLANGEDIQIPENVEGLPFPVADEVIGKPTIIDTTESGTTQTVETMQEEQTYVQNTENGEKQMSGPAQSAICVQNTAETVQENEYAGFLSENIPIRSADAEKKEIKHFEYLVQGDDNIEQENYVNFTPDVNPVPTQVPLQDIDKQVTSTALNNQKQVPSIKNEVQTSLPKTGSIFEYGDGSEENPYQVSTAAQLDAVRNDLTAHYIQTADIDLKGIEWTPIANMKLMLFDDGTINYDYFNRDYAFTGIYDGDGKAISNLSITKPDMQQLTYGLFGYCLGTIKNINLINAEIYLNEPSQTTPLYANEPHYIGALIGRSIDRWHNYCGIIENSQVQGKILTNWKPNLSIGGFVGYGSVVLNSVSYVNITCEDSYPMFQDKGGTQGYYGGIIGIQDLCHSMENTLLCGAIKECKNFGNITIKNIANIYVGGIGGCLRTAINTINYGDVSIIETGFPLESDYRYPRIAAGMCTGIMGGKPTSYAGLPTIQNYVNFGNLLIETLRTYTQDYSPRSTGLDECAGIIGNTQYDAKIYNNLYNLGHYFLWNEIDNAKESFDGKRHIYRISNGAHNWWPLTHCYVLKDFRINSAIDPRSIGHNKTNGESISASLAIQHLQAILPDLEIPEWLIDLAKNESNPSQEQFNTYYEGDNDWYTLTYKSSNPEKLDEELSQLVFFNNNPDLLSVTLSTWHKSGDSSNTATTTVPISALKGGITSFGLKLGEKIVSEVTCKIIPKFHLSSPGLTLEAESGTITLQTDSPFITEDFAKELLDKMTWTISGHEGVGAGHVHVEKGFSNGIVQFIFSVDPYLDASYDTYSKITIKGLSLRDITFNIRQKGFMSVYDLLLMEAVDQYVNPNKYIGELNRILQDTSLPTELRRQKYYEYLSNNGLLNRNEGVAWAKDAYEASHQFQYMTNNDLWLYSLYDDFLRNDPKGQGMIALLYANNLIIGGEYKDYIKPTTYLTEETPEVKKYKTLLYNFMSGTSEKKLASLKIDNWVKLISLSKTATGSEFVQSIKDLYQAPSSQAAFDKTLLQYASKYFGTSKIPDSTGIAIVDKINNGMKYAADAGKVLKVGVDVLNYAVKISAMSQVYQDYIDFFETIINGDTSIVPDTLKTAAFQIQCECSAMLEGYELQLTKLATETLWNEITDEILGEFLSDITKTLDLASFVANSLTGYKDFSNQVAYTQGYATLTNLYVSKIQSTAEAYKNSRSPELAKKFTDEYKYLKLLREKGEESYMNLCYKDTAVVKKVIGLFQSTQPWYEDRLNLMMDNIEYAKNAEFIFSETATSTSSRLAYEHKVIVQCPVDVQVYKGNELLFTIRDGHESDVSNEYGRFISVKRTFGDDYAKVVYLNDPNCYIKLIGQTDGLVTISHSQLKGEDVLTTVSDYNPVSAHSIMTYRLNDTDQKIEIDFDGDGNVDDTTILYPVSQEIILPGEIRVTKDRIELEKGQSIVIGVDILPFNTTNKDVLWESADESIITVKNGVLHAEGPGTTTIFVKTPNGLVSKTINVTVIQTTGGSGKPDIPTDPNKPSPTPNDPSLPAHPSLKPTLTQPQSPIIQLNVNHPMAVSGFIDPSSITQNSSEQKAEHVPTAVNTDAGLSILAMIGAGLGFGLARRRKKVKRR